MSMTTIAFDVAKAELVGARMSRNGIVKERYTIVNTPDAINHFLDSLNEKRVTIGSEATAEYHLNLARACIARSLPFKLINPLITKQFTRATIRKRKTDYDDAEIIGKCLLQGAGREVSARDLDPSTRILRTAADLSEMTHSLHLKHKRFLEHFPETALVQETLHEAQGALKKASEILKKHGAGLVDQKNRVLAQSVVGVGEALSSAIVSEIGDPHRFESEKQLVAYAGLDPKVKQSGASLKRNTSITKRGSPYLRRALFIAASVAQRHDPDLKLYYEKKKAEGKDYKTITIANARHVGSRVLAVLKRGTPYIKRASPEQFVQTISPELSTGKS